MYQLTSITPIKNLANKERKILTIAFNEALNSEFTSFKLGACIVGQR